VVDEHGRPVIVTGRGAVSASPALLRVAEQRRAEAIVGWAGPWPVDEHWWEAAHHRRVARFQIVTEDGRAHLLFAEHRRWWIGATYD
jgi:protein ImuB